MYIGKQTPLGTDTGWQHVLWNLLNVLIWVYWLEQNYEIYICWCPPTSLPPLKRVHMGIIAKWLKCSCTIWHKVFLVSLTAASISKNTWLTGSPKWPSLPGWCSIMFTYSFSFQIWSSSTLTCCYLSYALSSSRCFSVTEYASYTLPLAFYKSLLWSKGTMSAGGALVDHYPSWPVMHWEFLGTIWHCCADFVCWQLGAIYLYVSATSVSGQIQKC